MYYNRLLLFLLSIASVNAFGFAQELPTVEQIASKIEDEFKALNPSYLVTSVTQIGSVDQTERNGFDEMGFSGNKLFRKKKSWANGGWFERRHVYDGQRTGSEENLSSPSSPPRPQPSIVTSSLSEGKLLGNNTYMDAIGAPFYDGKSKTVFSFGQDGQLDPSSPFSIVKALRTNKYSIKPSSETVHDYKCMLIETDYDQIWLSEQLGYAIVKRIRNSRLRDEPVQTTIENYDFKQFGGIYLPLRCVVRQDFKRGSSKETITLGSVKFGKDVPQELFEISFKPGADVLDASIAPRKPDGTAPVVEYRAGEASEAKAKNLQAAAQNQEQTGTISRWSVLLVALPTVSILGILTFYLSRKVRAR